MCCLFYSMALQRMSLEVLSFKKGKHKSGSYEDCMTWVSINCYIYIKNVIIITK